MVNRLTGTTMTYNTNSTGQLLLRIEQLETENTHLRELIAQIIELAHTTTPHDTPTTSPHTPTPQQP